MIQMMENLERKDVRKKFKSGMAVKTKDASIKVKWAQSMLVPRRR